MKGFSKSLSASQTEFVILPPLRVGVPSEFEDVEIDNTRYGELLAAMQRFRGATYLFDGAILPTQLTADGRHILDIDDESWHVLILTQEGSVCGCLRFHEETSSKNYHQLGIASSALARCPIWGHTLRKAVEIHRFNAQHQHLRFGDVGGWAIAADRRNTLDPLLIILSTYSLLSLLGGAVGFATATCKHGSASILRRLGLMPVMVDSTEIPGYYDPHYRSEMEMLYFDSRIPSPKYANSVKDLSTHLMSAPVICAEQLVGYPTEPESQPNVKRWFPISAASHPPISESVS